jgi:hypothetical protein
MNSASQVDRQAIHADMEWARTAFHALLGTATEADLGKRTDATRWTNEQPLFRMLFGYILMRPLMALMRVFSCLPRGASRGFARLLNAAARPFHQLPGTPNGGTLSSATS